MLIDNLKIRSKLFIAFLVVLAFTVVVGIVAVTSIRNINRQIQVTNIANAVGDYADTAQAANLRFVYYKDSRYVNDSVSNLNNVISTLENTLKTITLSEENRKKSEDIISITKKLIENTNLYLKIAEERDNYYQRLSALTEDMIKNADSLLGIGVSFIENSERNGMVGKAGFERFLDNLKIKDNIHSLNNIYMNFRLSLSESDKARHAQAGSEILDKIESDYKAIYQRMALAESRAQINRSLEDVSAYREIMKSVLQLAAKDTETITLMRESILDIVALSGEIKEYAQELVHQTTNRSITLIIVSILLIIALSIIITMVITNSITVPLKRFIGFITQNLATGDLTADIQKKDLQAKDEIGDAARGITVLVEKLREVIAIMQEASTQVSSGSDQIAESSQQLSSGASEQAASMEEVSSSMEQLVSNIEQNSENASSADTIAKKLASDAQEGEKIGRASCRERVLERV